MPRRILKPALLILAGCLLGFLFTGGLLLFHYESFFKEQYYLRIQDNANVAIAEAPYDFRAAHAYRKLSSDDRHRLEQVHRDFMMLWGALDSYADRHHGKPPDTLDQLLPHYLGHLPSDPFATAQTPPQNDTKPYHTSKDGRGYRYRNGSPANRAWCLDSVGLPGFPYLAASGNVGLSVCKGRWISGMNATLVKDNKKPHKTHAGHGR